MYESGHSGSEFSTFILRYSREFVITVIVITEFDCRRKSYIGSNIVLSLGSNIVRSERDIVGSPVRQRRRGVRQDQR